MEISNPLSTSLKCPTCRMSFTEDSQHKQHYKSDFHRYNLKRTMVNLAPATLEQFSTKRSEVRLERQTTFQCGQCRKSFNSQQTLALHGTSKRHDINKILEERPNVIKQQKPKIYIKNYNCCLFCQVQSSNLEQSLKHMSKDHGFFIAQQNYCTSKANLILYLQQKIEVGMLCIFCDNKGCHDFATGQAVRNHMVSKRHTFMNTQNGFEEYQNHYDFSELFKEKLQEQKTYSKPVGINFEKVKVIVDDQNDKQSKAIKMQKVSASAENMEEEWQDEEQGEQQWEDQSEEQNDDTIHEKDEQEEMKQKKRQKVRAYQIMVPTLTSTDELLLPNGKMLGHRKYRHIYRQAIKLNNWIQTNKQSMLQSGQNQHALILRNNLLGLIKKENIMKTTLRNLDKKYVKSGIQNSNLFRHFRSSNPL